MGKIIDCFQLNLGCRIQVPILQVRQKHKKRSYPEPEGVCFVNVAEDGERDIGRSEEGRVVDAKFDTIAVKDSGEHGIGDKKKKIDYLGPPPPTYMTVSINSGCALYSYCTMCHFLLCPCPLLRICPILYLKA